MWKINEVNICICPFKQLSDILKKREINITFCVYHLDDLPLSLLSFGMVDFGGACKTILQPLFLVNKKM